LAWTGLVYARLCPEPTSDGWYRDAWNARISYDGAIVWTRLTVVVLMAAGLSYAGDEKPLPTRRSVILNRRGATYFVEGRQTIPWGCEISISRDVKIVGRGEDPVLVVAGALHVHGTNNKNVFIEDLVIEPAARFREIRLDMVRFQGSGGIRNDDQKPVAGSIVVENSVFSSSIDFDVALSAGQVLILASSFSGRVVIDGVVAKGKLRNALSVNIIGCGSTAGRSLAGFQGGLFLTGANKVVVRNSRLGGERTEFRNCATITFDGNKVSATQLCFFQKNFARTKLQKSDFYCETLILCGPPRARKQRVLIDKCWFKGLTRAKDINEEVIQDAKDHKNWGAVAMFRQIKKQPLMLGGPQDR